MADPVEPRFSPAGDAPESAPPSRRLQLRLHHFFTFTAVAAVILAVMGPVLAQWSDNDDQMPKLMTVVSISWSMLYTFCLAAALTAVAYGMASRRHGIPFLDMPGHWLLFEIGVTGVLWFVPYVVIWRFVARNGSGYTSSMAFYWISMLVFVAANLALNIYIAWKKCHEWRWKSVFLLKSLSAVSQFVVSFPVGAIAVMIALLVAIARDRRKHAARDAGHWCGVGLEFTTCVLALGSSAISWLYIYYMQ